MSYNQGSSSINRTIEIVIFSRFLFHSVRNLNVNLRVDNPPMAKVCKSEALFNIS